MLGPRYGDFEALEVSSQKVGANPCGCPPGQAQDLPLPQDIEKIPLERVLKVHQKSGFSEKTRFPWPGQEGVGRD
jgi:hypothetical protein